MAIYQVFVRNLDGKTQCLRFTSPEVCSEDLKAELAAREGVRGDLMRLVTGTREVENDSVLLADADGHFPSCSLLLRLEGGKGGFGSLLRGAATKAGQKKTSNFDACRDMSGRRLRHVNAEKKLKEWKADAKERELEKTAEEFLKKQKRKEAEDDGMEKELAKFRKESLQAREEVGSAVMDGLVEAAKLGVDLKRKKVEAIEFEVKRVRTWSPNDHDSSEDDDGEETDSDSDDEPGPSSSGKEGTEDEGKASIPDKSEEWLSPALGTEAGSSGADEDVKLVRKDDDDQASTRPAQQSGNPEEGRETAKKESENPEEGPVVSYGPSGVFPSRSNGGEAVASASPLLSSDASNGTEVLGFEKYETSKDLEVLGLERLKIELQNRGLKCGGSLSERAARLFLLKKTSIEKLDKSHFAKPSRKAATK